MLKSIKFLFITLIIVAASYAFAADTIIKKTDGSEINVTEWVSLKTPLWNKDSHVFVKANLESIGKEIAQLDLLNATYETLPYSITCAIDFYTSVNEFSKEQLNAFASVLNQAKYAGGCYARTMTTEEWEYMKETYGGVFGTKYSTSIYNLISFAQIRGDSAYIKQLKNEGKIKIEWSFYRPYLAKYFTIQERYNYLNSLENIPESWIKIRNELFVRLYQQKMLGK